MSKAAEPKEPATPRGTDIRRCTCTNPFQDIAHGRGLRVHNAMKGGSRCTSCSREEKRL